MEEDDTTGLEAGAMMVIDGMILIQIVTTIPAVTITHEIITTTMSIVEEDTPLTVSTEGMMVTIAT